MVNVSRVEDGRLIGQLLLVNTCVKAVAWVSGNEEKQLLATGTGHGAVIVWKMMLNWSTEIRRRAYHGEIDILEYSDVTKRLFIVHDDSVSLWNMKEDQGDENPSFIVGERVGGMGVLTSGSACVVSQPCAQKMSAL